MLCDDCEGHMSVHPKEKPGVLRWTLILCHTVATTDEHVKVQLKGQNRMHRYDCWLRQRKQSEGANSRLGVGRKGWAEGGRGGKLTCMGMIPSQEN